MNSLGKDLKVGQFVVFKKGIMLEEFQALDQRTAEIVSDMFGNHSFTTGTAILVKFKDGEVSKMSGMDIEGLATEDRYLAGDVQS
jgi:hypothetical protein